MTAPAQKCPFCGNAGFYGIGNDLEFTGFYCEWCEAAAHSDAKYSRVNLEVRNRSIYALPDTRHMHPCDSPMLHAAYCAARSARFEFGEEG